MNNPQKHTAVVVALVASAMVIIGLLAFLLLNGSKTPVNSSPTATTASVTQSTVSTTKIAAMVSWESDGKKWTASGDAPACPSPLKLEPPVDLSLVTNILYPGQVRGGDFKAHGGFRFDTASTNAINVTMPIDAYLYEGVRYYEAGELQYLLGFINPCGIMIRFDHILTLSPELAKIVEKELPAAVPNDSRTTRFQTQKLFKAGELVATEVGFANPRNVSVDFGVYDLRQQNTISKQNSAWAQQYTFKATQAYYAVCWLDFLNTTLNIKALPGSGTEGKTSDYCSQ